jgi:hypothetical protein
MRKFLAGCLVGLVLIAVAGSVAAYLVWRAARPVVDSVTHVADGLKGLRAADDIERELTNRAAFSAPQSGELTPEQVARFIRVQHQVRAALGSRIDAFTAKYRELSGVAADGSPSVPSLPQLIAGLSDVPVVYLDALRAQVQAMNAEGFSRDEWSWVRLRVYQAAGLDAVRYDARDLERAIKSVADGVQARVPEVTLPDAPARNRELVKPYVGELTTWLGMAVFGL